MCGAFFRNAALSDYTLFLYSLVLRWNINALYLFIFMYLSVSIHLFVYFYVIFAVFVFSSSFYLKHIQLSFTNTILSPQTLHPKHHHYHHHLALNYRNTPSLSTLQSALLPVSRRNTTEEQLINTVNTHEGGCDCSTHLTSHEI